MNDRAREQAKSGKRVTRPVEQKNQRHLEIRRTHTSLSFNYVTPAYWRRQALMWEQE